MLEFLFISEIIEISWILWSPRKCRKWLVPQPTTLGLAAPRDALNVLRLTEGFDHIAIGWARDLQPHHGQHGQCDQPFQKRIFDHAEYHEKWWKIWMLPWFYHDLTENLMMEPMPSATTVGEIFTINLGKSNREGRPLAPSSRSRKKVAGWFFITVVTVVCLG